VAQFRSDLQKRDVITAKLGCHPVSNDAAACQAILSDTSPLGAFDFSEAPFSLS
jgi:hypothetical protein